MAVTRIDLPNTIITGSIMNKRTLSLIIVGIAVLAAGGGLFSVKTTYESKVRNDIENFLANLPQPLECTAGKIDVSFLGKSVVISDLTGSYKGKEAVTFSLAKISATGINTDAAKDGAGPTDIAKTLVVEKVVYGSPLFSATIDQYAYQGISGDLNQIIDETIKAMPTLITVYTDPEYITSEKKQIEALGKLSPLIAASETLTIGSATMRNLSYTVPVMDKELAPGQKVVVKIAEGNTGKYSLREMENMLFKDVSVTPEGSATPLITIESLGMDGAKLPSFAALFKALSQDTASPALLQAALQGQSFALKNLAIKNMSIHNPENLEQTVLSLANGTFNYIAENAHDIDLRFDGMKVDKMLMENNGFPKNALALMPETLSHSGAVRITVTAKDAGDKTYDLECTKIAFSEDTLGNFSLSFAIDDLNPMALAFGMPGPAVLKNFDFSAKDTGASDVFFTVRAEDENATAASLRAQAVDSLPAQDTLPNDALRELMSAVATFLEKPGSTLRITLAPASPLNLQEFQAALEDPAKLGLTVMVAPAQ